MSFTAPLLLYTIVFLLLITHHLGHAERDQYNYLKSAKNTPIHDHHPTLPVDPRIWWWGSNDKDKSGDAKQDAKRKDSIKGKPTPSFKCYCKDNIDLCPKFYCAR